MCSFEEDDGCDKLDGGEEVACEFVISRCYTTVIFENIEESFDEIALFVEGEVTGSLDYAIGLGRYDGSNVTLGEGIDECVGVISFVGEESLRIDLVEQRLGLAEVGRLSGG